MIIFINYFLKTKIKNLKGIATTTPLDEAMGWEG
jgi:hypothetical protein